MWSVLIKARNFSGISYWVSLKTQFQGHEKMVILGRRPA